jgi:hypothetical protein
LPSLLDDADREVRLEAFDNLLRLRMHVDARDEVLRWLGRVDDSERDQVIIRWRRVEGEPAIVAALAGASRDVRRHALDWLDATSWRDVAPFFENDPEFYWHGGFCRDFALAELPLALLVETSITMERTEELMVEVGCRLQAGAPVESSVAARLDAFAARCASALEALDGYDEDGSWPDADWIRVTREGLRRARDQALARS